jgi:hypothetical protein
MKEIRRKSFDGAQVPKTNVIRALIPGAATLAQPSKYPPPPPNPQTYNSHTAESQSL